MPFLSETATIAPMDNFQNLSTSLGLLSAMLTPAVLISACASLALSTSQRLSRVTDRVRRMSSQFKELVMSDPDSIRLEEEAFLLDQLTRTVRRARLLQRSLTSTYLALTVFVATSVSIGVVAITEEKYAGWPIVLSGVGVTLLFRSSALLILEAYVARRTIDLEMQFVLKLAEKQAPTKVREHRQKKAIPHWIFLQENLEDLQDLSQRFLGREKS